MDEGIKLTSDFTTGPTPQPPGWYMAPGEEKLERWWDGQQWSAHIRPRSSSNVSTSRNINRALAAVGILVTIIGVFVGYSTVFATAHDTTVECGSAFSPTNVYALAAVQEEVIMIETHRSTYFTTGDYFDACDAARSGKKTLAIGLIVPAVLLLGYGILAFPLRRYLQT